MLKKIYFLLIVIYILFFSCTSEQPAIAFINISVVPMNEEFILKHQTVIIQNGLISNIGNTETIKPPSKCIKIDGTGKYLIPGLADMHAHVWDENELKLFITNGVTTIRNMSGNPKHLEFKKKILNGGLLGPTIYTAGAVLDGFPPIWPGSVEIEGPIQSEKIISKQKTDGFDFLKIYNNLSLPAFNAIMALSKKYKMPVAGHVPFDVSLEHALNSGISSIEHFEGYGIALQTDNSPVTDYHESMTKTWINLDDNKLMDIVKKTKDSGVWNCPTMIVFQHLFVSPKRLEIFRNKKEMQYVAPSLLENWLSRDYNSEIAQIADKINHARKKLLKALHEANANILLGTDCGNPFTVHGFSIHEELECFVDAGISPYEAIKAGTVNAAVYLETINYSGTIEIGKKADLLCIESNPLIDVKNINKIFGVMIQGLWYSKSKLKEMLDDIAISNISQTKEEIF